MSLPSEADLRRTGAAIASTQHACGAIPWDVQGDTAGKVDPWDHVECAMALLATGFVDEAHAAYDFLAGHQRADGSWPAQWRIGGTREGIVHNDTVGGAGDSSTGDGGASDSSTGDGDDSDSSTGDGDGDDTDGGAASAGGAGPLEIVDAGFDTNLSGYLAVGIWHHWRTCREREAVRRWWPAVAASLEAIAALQLPSGAIAWADGPYGPADHGLLAGSSCLHLAFRCGAILGEVAGDPRPQWHGVADRIAAAVRTHADDPAVFAPKHRYSMDWYYPVLGGALTGAAAHDRLAARWDDFVHPGLGILCVDDHPWVTGAETCELALSLTALDRHAEAATLVADMQHLRDTDGAYWTGYVYPDDARWPIERSTWTSAVVVLATKSLTQ